MSKPTIANSKPIMVKLEKGEEKYWCACGLSSNQPYCDGSHRTTDIIQIYFYNCGYFRILYLCQKNHCYR